MKKTSNDCKPTWYHVVFFDVPQVKRAWIRVEEVFKLEDIKQPPKGSTNMRPGLKLKWKKILNMASDCAELGREERLEKYSFAALFDGKWGYYDENTKIVKGKKAPTDESTNTATDASPKVSKNWKPSDLLNLWNNNSLLEKVNTEEWVCDLCQKYFPYVENVVLDHLRFHHMDIQVWSYTYKLVRDKT